MTFNDVLTFHLNGGEITAVHLAAAHTDGDAAIYFRAPNVLHTGDVYVQYGFPFIDRSSGGSLDGMIRGADTMIGLINDSTKVIPGHGQIANRAALRTYRNMLATVRDRVRKQAAAGASLDRILASKPTREFDAEWGKGFIKPDDFVRGPLASSAAPPGSTSMAASTRWRRSAASNVPASESSSTSTG